MNISYMLYQAERTHSTAEQREIDVTAGELAATFARRGRTVRRAVARRQGTGHQGTKRAGRRATTATASCAIPSPR